jgi:Zn-dependent M28 family amino/carboxypeptidase
MSKYEFNNTIKFALWNSEEEGYQGSSDYATYAARNSLNIPLYFNFDSSGYDPDNQYVLDIMYDEESEPIAELLTQYNSLYDINFTLTYNVHDCGSDYEGLKRYGYPVIMTHSQSHGPQAHTPNDTIDMMSPEFARKNAQLGMSVLARLLEIQP